MPTTPALNVPLALLKDSASLPKGDGASGHLFGCKVVFRFATRGSGSWEAQWTEVEVSAPMHDLSLQLRPTRCEDHEDVRAGRVVDVTFDDPHFDDWFVAEGAPTDVIQAWLHPSIRKQLLALEPIELTTSTDKLCLAKRDWLSDPDKIRQMLELAATLGASVGDAWHRANQAGNPGYRSVPHPTVEMQQRREQDRVELDESKRRRSKHIDRKLILSILQWVIVCVLIAAACLLFSRCE